jgi:hypothetical protein
MKSEPQNEHRWLDRLVGEWTVKAEMPPEAGDVSGPPWTERVRSLDGLWVVCEAHGEMPGGDAATTLMTLGYDPAKGRYVGTFVGSMMTHMWVYEGTLDAAGNALTLDCEGPDFAEAGRTARYQDIITFTGDDSRTLTSRMLGADGEWRQVMFAEYRRNT